jgi:hypothetical protein
MKCTKATEGSLNILECIPQGYFSEGRFGLQEFQRNSKGTIHHSYIFAPVATFGLED